MTAENTATPAAEIQTGEGTETPEVVQPESAESPSPAEDGTDKPELTPEQKQIRALQRRVDRLTRDKYATRAQLEEAQRQLSSAQSQEQQDQDPEKRGFTEQDIERRARELLEMETIQSKANAIAAAGEKAFTDFPQKVAAVMEEVPLFLPNGKPTPVMEAIADAEKPEALLYHLGENPEIAAELAELSPARQARRIALLEQEIASAKPGKSKPAVSASPQPLKPEKPAGNAAKSEQDMSDAEWAAFKAAQRANARR